MTRKPTAWQKLIHRFLMLRSITAFFAPWIHHLDRGVLKLTKGRYSLAAVIGWNVIQLTTTGAKTGQPRTLPLIGLFDGERIALIASSFGRRHNPAWYYNLKAHPECKVQSSKGKGTYLGREAEGEEYQKYWQMGVSIYEGYEKYKERASHRHIPVMVLEPKETQ